MAFNNFSGIGRSGTGTLKVDGKVVETKKMEKTIPIILQWDESFDIGSDTITGVNDADYLPPFPLTAKFNKLTIKIDRPQLSPEDIKKLEEGMKKAAPRHRNSRVAAVKCAGRFPNGAARNLLTLARTNPSATGRPAARRRQDQLGR